MTRPRQIPIKVSYSIFQIIALKIFFNILGLNLFERRRMRCEDYTMVSDPQQENPDRVQEDMFKMKQDYANFTGRVKNGSTGNLKVSQGA